MPATTSDFPQGRRSWTGALLLAIAFGVAAAAAWPARAAGAPEAGQIAPALIARSFKGEAIDLAALRGKVVVLNFWASWCSPCRSEMPLLDALSRDYHDRGVVVIGMSADDPHDRKDALKAAAGVSYLTGLLAEASVNGFGDPQVLPLTYIIGSAGTLGVVMSANRGALSEGQLRAAVDAQLRPADGAVAAPARSTR